jgi:6-phosphogluconolactonase
MNPQVRVFPDTAALALAAAGEFAAAAETAVRRDGIFFAALSGGRSPLPAYDAMAGPLFRERVRWRDVHVFWTDERCAGPDHPQSNYGAAKSVLLDRVSIPEGNVHRIRAEETPDRAADLYETELRTVMGSRFSETGRLFDWTLLGMGEDGHTASLFPGTPAMDETRRWAISVYIERLRASRITLTLPAINASEAVFFIVTGASKASALARVLNPVRTEEVLPAGLISPASGRLAWLVDTAAAGPSGPRPTETTGG